MKACFGVRGGKAGFATGGRGLKTHLKKSGKNTKRTKPEKLPGKHRLWEGGHPEKPDQLVRPFPNPRSGAKMVPPEVSRVDQGIPGHGPSPVIMAPAAPTIRGVMCDNIMLTSVWGSAWAPAALLWQRNAAADADAWASWGKTCLRPNRSAIT